MCRSFPALRPSDVLGLLDEAIAFDFDCAAALVLQLADDRKAVMLAKAQVGLTWGGATEQTDSDSSVNAQSRANDFFG